jgi:hypothetical protein
MKTTKITLQLTPNELFEIAFALEAQIKEAVKYPHVKTVKYLKEWECPEETKLLTHFMSYHGYTPNTIGNDRSFDSYKNFHQIDEWLNSLMKTELKRRKSIPKA